LLILLLVPLASADLLKHHLEHLVDYSVNPCSDFYAHVCRRNTPDGEFIKGQLRTLFEGISEEFRENATQNNEILRDIEKMMNAGDDCIKDVQYEALARERCGDNLECYRANREYFLKKFAMLDNTWKQMVN
ncbi:hypothetical protein PMAYCL1PPCAC_33240, partial [Pristionchus mayeri]